MQHRPDNDSGPAFATDFPPARLLTTPPRPSRLVFHQTYASVPIGPIVDGTNMDLDAVRRLRLQLERISALAAPCLHGPDSDESLTVAVTSQEAPADVAEDEYDDDTVVVKHSGKRLLPVLYLKCRWRKPASRSRLMVFYLKLRQKVVKRAFKTIERFRWARAFLLHRKAQVGAGS